MTKQDRVKEVATKTIARREIKERLLALKKRSEPKNDRVLDETPAQKQQRLRQAREASGESKPKLHLGHFFRSQIATCRTNLDHFSEVEAASLMSTGSNRSRCFCRSLDAQLTRSVWAGAMQAICLLRMH